MLVSKTSDEGSTPSSPAKYLRVYIAVLVGSFLVIHTLLFDNLYKYDISLYKCYKFTKCIKIMNKEKNKIDKRDRFKRLAEYRTNTVLKRLKVLGNCANRSAYNYTEEDIDKIFSVIEKSVKEVKSKFHFSKNKEFKL